MMAFIDQGVAFVIGVFLASLVWGCLALWSMRPEQETQRRTGGRRWSDHAADQSDKTVEKSGVTG